jgi:ribosomal protein L31
VFLSSIQMRSCWPNAAVACVGSPAVHANVCETCHAWWAEQCAGQPNELNTDLPVKWQST